MTFARKRAKLLAEGVLRVSGSDRAAPASRPGTSCRSATGVSVLGWRPSPPPRTPRAPPRTCLRRRARRPSTNARIGTAGILCFGGVGVHRVAASAVLAARGPRAPLFRVRQPAIALSCCVRERDRERRLLTRQSRLARPQQHVAEGHRHMTGCPVRMLRRGANARRASSSRPIRASSVPELVVHDRQCADAPRDGPQAPRWRPRTCFWRDELRGLRDARRPPASASGIERFVARRRAAAGAAEIPERRRTAPRPRPASRAGGVTVLPLEQAIELRAQLGPLPAGFGRRGGRQSPPSRHRTSSSSDPPRTYRYSAWSARTMPRPPNRNWPRATRHRSAASAMRLSSSSSTGRSDRPRRPDGNRRAHEVEDGRQEVDVLHRRDDAAARARAVGLLDDERHVQAPFRRATCPTPASARSPIRTIVAWS